MEKAAQHQEAQMVRADFEIIYDMLRDKTGDRLVVYLETPGGNGDAAKEIADFLHTRFNEVHYLITGEAKSAGTILALSGDEIMMTGSGALGPIDAQVQTGRANGSAHGYLAWVEETREKAQKQGWLNPFDATMVAQISPTELRHVDNAFNFAKDLVKEWLPKYKFKNWDKTEGKGEVVTPERRIARAEEIATKLTNLSQWRMHNRSLKIKEMSEIGLKVYLVDKNPELADAVYRLQAVNRMLFGSTTNYKFFATKDDRINRTAVQKGAQANIDPAEAFRQTDFVIADVQCTACKRHHKRYIKLEENIQAEQDAIKQGAKAYPKDGKINCECGNVVDISGIRNDIEMRSGKKAIIV